MMGMPAKKMRGEVAFTYEGADVLFNDNRLVSLTDMWKAAGKPATKKVAHWRQIDETADFVASVAEKQKVRPGYLFAVTPGRNGGTFAHWQIALAYGKYLSPEFHQHVNSAYREWCREEADPGLKVERGIQGYKRKGYDPAWIKERVEGIDERNHFTQVLSNHNVKNNGKHDNGYAEVSRTVSLGATGFTPSEFKKRNGLKPSARTRDHYDRVQLHRAKNIEFEAGHLIQNTAADGNSECAECCRKVVRETKRYLEAIHGSVAIH